jgi:hypothetical protein
MVMACDIQKPTGRLIIIVFISIVVIVFISIVVVFVIIIAVRGRTT